jgi:hypothetical protein
VIDHRSFASCAHDLSMHHHVENAIKQLLRNDPLYKKVGDAARCLIGLSRRDFPKEILADVDLLFSVFPYIEYMGIYGEYPNYTRIPRRLQHAWFPALLRVYRLLMIAQGAASVLPITDSATIDKACRDHVSAFF